MQNEMKFMFIDMMNQVFQVHLAVLIKSRLLRLPFVAVVPHLYYSPPVIQNKNTFVAHRPSICCGTVRHSSRRMIFTIRSQYWERSRQRAGVRSR